MSDAEQLLSEIKEIEKELLQIEELEQELRTSLSEARRQISYYKGLIAAMKRSSHPSSLQNVLRFF